MYILPYIGLAKKFICFFSCKLCNGKIWMIFLANPIHHHCSHLPLNYSLPSLKFSLKVANTLHHSKWTALSITGWSNLRPSLFLLILLIIDLNQTWDSREQQGNFMGYWDQVSKECDDLYLNLLGFYLQFLG